MSLLLVPRADIRTLESQSVLARFGSPQKLIESFGLRVQRYCLKNEERAVASGVPSLRKMLAAYGEDTMLRLLRIHASDVLIRVGDDGVANPEDVEHIAEGIVDMDYGKSLTFTSTLAFFIALKNGAFHIYGRVTSRKIMECYRTWCEQTRVRQDTIREKLEKEREMQALPAPASRPVTWEEYARRRGIKEPTLWQHVLNTRKSSAPCG